jgi:DNA helicase HerA-like ATPase
MEDVLNGYTRVDRKTDVDFIYKCLKRGVKLNYVPHRDKKIGRMELRTLTEISFDLGDIFIIVDEAEEYGYQGMSTSPCFDIAMRGRHYEVYGLFICQDPATLDKCILRNCEIMRVFRFNEYANNYFSRLQYDVEEMRRLLKTKDHGYIKIEGGLLQGVYRENGK